MTTLTHASPPRVLKFGGTSVGSVALLRRSLALTESAARQERTVVVVSAFAGVTDQLVQAIDHAAAGDAEARTIASDLRERIAALRDGIAPEAATPELQAELELELTALETRLESIARAGLNGTGAGPNVRAQVLATGERIAAPLFAALLRARGIDAVARDAAKLLIAHGDPLEASVDQHATLARVRAWWTTQTARVTVVTGFLAGDAQGEVVLLGRGGSDLSATTIGAALGARTVTLWSDVDGVLDADPHEVPQARTLARLDTEGATLLARHGARVLHPRALEPARLADIEVRARQTSRPQQSGTRLRTAVRTPYVAIASDRGYVRLEVRASMSAAALADALRARAVPILATEPCDSGVSLMLPAASLACARAALAALSLQHITQCERDHRHAVVAAITHVPSPRLAARIAAALAAAGLRAALAPVATTARSVAVVVPAAARVAAVRALHAALTASRARVDVVLIGARGRVATALTRLLADRGGRLQALSGVDLHLVGAATRQLLLWDDAGLDPATLAEQIGTLAVPSDRDALLAQLLAPRTRPRIVVDCTASEEIAALYPELLAAGIGVVTPNKRANARRYAFWRGLQERARANGVPYRYTTTVGAGLPVLASARALRRRGDRLRSFEGVLSGSISAILHSIQGGTAFSAAVADAHEKGFTEPHPGEDLSGEDVARKLLLVLREAGLPLEREAIHVEPLVAGTLAREQDPARFMAALPEFDTYWHARVVAAQARKERLVFVARYDGVRATVAVESRPVTDPLARLRAGENIVVLHSDHHSPLPLTLAGPGAGAELTAAGVLTDLLEAGRRTRGRARARRTSWTVAA